MRIAQILREIQSRTGANQTELGRRFKVSQPTISRWINEKDEPDRASWDAILGEARKLSVIPEGTTGVPISVQVVGYVGAGGAVDFSHGQGPFGEVEMPPSGDPRTTVAVVVRGDSMSGQLEDGWTVYFDHRKDPPTADLLHKLCVVGLSDGRILIKKLLPGRQSGRYDLYSTNAKPELDVAIDWAARVSWIAPR